MSVDPRVGPQAGQPIDLLIHARRIIPIEPSGLILEHAAVAISAGRIIAIGPSIELSRQFNATSVIHRHEHVLIPGLVNAHTHAAMTLLRGYGDDMPLMRWLQERIWPAEAQHVGPDFVYDGTLIAAAEMIRSGVTCANDMYFYPASAAQAFVDAGMRATIGIIAFEFATRYGSGAEDYLIKGLAVRDRYRDEPLLNFALAPHAPYTVADSTFRRVVTLAEELDLPIHCHIHETLDEIERSLAEHGVRPLQRLHALGVVSARLMAVHAVHLSGNEIDLLARHGASVIHCPSSNLKLASGLAPIAALANAGVNIGLGTDSAASNNRLDILTEMRTAALLAKVVAGDATVLPAPDALLAATLGGARALGMEQSIGSIIPGKQADIVAVCLSDPFMGPAFNSHSQLVYAASREHVSDVWINGIARLTDGKLTGIDAERLAKTVYMWQNKVVT